jgi:multidrug resistance protein MdtO
MTSAASTSPLPALQASRFLEFLRRELAPSPQRWRATLRITLACVAASFPVMAFHLHLALIVMILMFLISKEDTTTTLLGTVLGIIGVTIGSGLLLLTYVCFVDLTWLRVLLVPGFIALGLFLNRILTLGPMGSAIGVPLALGMVVPDVIPSTEFLTRFPFYLWWAAVLGLSVNLVVQYLLNPERAKTVLARGLISRLEAVEASLLRLAGEKRPRSSVSLQTLAVEGAAEQLHLLKLASAAEPFLKRHHAGVGAQIILVDRLVTAAAVLEEQGVALNQAVETRLRRIPNAAATWRQAILERRWPQIPDVQPETVGQASSPPVQGASSPVAANLKGSGAPPMLLEMERVLDLLPRARDQESMPEELKVFPKEGSAVVPDAFTNPEYIHFAIKGALAGFICYLIFTLSAYQGIYTSVVTCIVCSLSTIGASVQKGVLRFAGSAVGGVLGVITLTCIFPYVDSIGGFWIPFAVVTALAAYVTLSGPSLSYGGYQIGLAFYKCVLQSYGPYTELRVVRDRLVGIFLGLAVFGLINSRLWPVKALESIRAKLASALQILAKLAALPDESKDPTPRLAQAYELRLQAYQQFRAVHELVESAKFEPGEAFRQKLEGISATAQGLLLYLLAIIQHRPDLRPESVAGPLRDASSRFRTRLADELQILSNRVVGQHGGLDQDLQGALVELEQAVDSESAKIANTDVAAHVRARLALYQATVPLVVQLAPAEVGK